MNLSREDIDELVWKAQNGILPIPQNMQEATMALFIENALPCRFEERGIKPVYNLTKTDTKETKSFYRLYMQCLTEYEAAMVTLGSWEHWERLSECSWFHPYLKRWRHETEVRNKALAIRAVMEQTAKGNISAAKMLLDLERASGKPAKRENTKADRAASRSYGQLPQESKTMIDSILERATVIKEELNGNPNTH
jgi:hypothetical protein